MPKAKGKEKEWHGEPGDTVLVHTAGGKHQGVLLPQPKNDTNFVTIKLSSGYNIGIRKEKVERIEVIEHASASSALAKKEHEETCGKPTGRHISLLGCGGTIVNRIDYRTGAVYPSTSPKELIEGLPALSKFEIKARTLFSIASEDMAPSHWVKIAEAASDEIREGARGIVIAHGTDTMHYTSAALSFMLKNVPCPVILTGSQRSSDRGSSDAEGNLHASALAAQANISGVFICMHENTSDESCLLHFGAKARKMHTSRRDAFRSISCLPAARVLLDSGKVETISGRCQPRKPLKDFSLDTRMNENVALQYIYPGIKPKAISALSECDGVVLAGFGLGHLPVNAPSSILAETKALIASGIPVVFASQTLYGRTDMSVYSNQRILRDAGVMGHMCDMTPETAYVKLMCVLGKEKKLEKVKELMETNIAGEISDRTEITGY